jgi:hypothetical protein
MPRQSNIPPAQRVELVLAVLRALIGVILCAGIPAGSSGCKSRTVKA